MDTFKALQVYVLQQQYIEGGQIPPIIDIMPEPVVEPVKEYAKVEEKKDEKKSKKREKYEEWKPNSSVAKKVEKSSISLKIKKEHARRREDDKTKTLKTTAALTNVKHHSLNLSKENKHSQLST
jgi:hypothetical protein